TERMDQEILDWLGPLNPTAKQADILSRRQPGTGNWMTEHAVFKEWLEGARNRLWCPGMHGAGKTVLTAVIIDYLQREVLSENMGLAFLYCSYNDQPVQNITNIISSLARQLVRKQAPLPQDLALLFSQHKDRKTRPSLDECRTLLFSLINQYTRCFIILDALDETNERDGTRHDLIAELKKLSASTKILITSRYCTSDEEYFEPSLKIEIRALEADLVAYVGARMVEESRLTKHFKKEPGLAPLVLESVVKQAQGIFPMLIQHRFLLAELHMESIVKKQNLKDVKQAFKDLPRSLNNTYENVIMRISAQEEHDVDLAMKVLSWISCAARPLNILELQHAIATDPLDETFDSDALIDQDILASVCGGLVSIDPETATVRLIHHTAQEYFERHGDRIFPEARTNIARTCVAYLSFKTFCDGVLSPRQKSEIEDDANIALFDLFDDEGITSPLHSAAQSGHVSAASFLVEKGLPIDGKSESGWTPLHWAAERRNLDVLVYLLTEGAKVDLQTAAGQTALHKAATKRDYTDVVATLLKFGASVTARTQNGNTALHIAAEKGNNEVVSLLL
ncbi:hypothetical protein N431DRAFT_317626, partial [Stipitochalara longipes BDJ]